MLADEEALIEAPGELEKPSRAVREQDAPRAATEIVQGVQRGSEHGATQLSDRAAGFSSSPPVAELLLDYQVLSNGEPIGRLRTERRRGWLDDLPVLQVSNRMDLRCSGLWFDYSLQSDESMDFGADGLCRYAGVSDEDGDKTVIKGRLRQGVLTLRLHDGQLEVRRFKQGDFDASSEDAAERFLAGGQAEATLRVLDLEHFDIDEVRYQRLPDETLDLLGQPRQARVVAYQSKRRKISGTGWYLSDDGGEVLVRQSSRERGDHNEVILTDWESKPCQIKT